MDGVVQYSVYHYLSQILRERELTSHFTKLHMRLNYMPLIIKHNNETKRLLKSERQEIAAEMLIYTYRNVSSDALTHTRLLERTFQQTCKMIFLKIGRNMTMLTILHSNVFILNNYLFLSKHLAIKYSLNAYTVLTLLKCLNSN